MSIITYTRAAKCKDCKFLKPIVVGKKKIHECSNELSERFKKQITLKDFVCDKWKLI